MNNLEFQALIESVEAAFNKKYSQPLKDRLYERVKRVPGQHVKAIIERLESLERHPDNLGAVVLGIWRSMDQGAGQETEIPGCAECGPRGVIRWFIFDKAGGISTGVAFCPVCRPGSPHAVTREQLRERGFLVPEAGEAADRLWWSRYQRHTAKRLAKRQGKDQGGGLDAETILQDFERLAHASAERPANRPHWNDPD